MPAHRLSIRTISLSLTAAAALAVVMAAAPSTQPAECCEPTAAVAAAHFTAPSTQPAKGDEDAAALFEKLKSLAGTWNGEAMGQPCKFEYTVTGGGSAVVENQDLHGGMMTVYTLDDAGDAGKPRVIVTHYCAAGNQPRMASTGLTGDHASFAFLDATGLKSENDPHMHQLALTFNADGSVQQSWTMFVENKAKGTVSVKLKRAV